MKEEKSEDKVQIQQKWKFKNIGSSEEPISPNIDIVRYSNQILITRSEVDLILDFLELPGTFRDNAVHVRGTRIYLTIEKARKLQEALGKVLKNDEGIDGE